MNEEVDGVFRDYETTPQEDAFQLLEPDVAAIVLIVGIVVGGILL